MKTGIILAVVLVLAFVVSGCVTTTGTGKLVLQITDKPALNIEKAEVTISNVQVHIAETGNESGWFTVVDEPQTFDLVAIKDVKEYLGENELAAGIYTQIRLDVDNAKVTINGTEHNLTISSKTVKLVRSFEIAEGETTTLTLDFDAEESVHEANGRYTMRPTIKVLGPSPGKTDNEQDEVTCSASTGESMDLEEAKEIALASDCVENGTLKDTNQCNADTGTWWIDLDIEREGCSPACVVDITEGTSEINWRCTGVV